MTTIRVPKRHRYTAIDRRTINDKRLSFGARGLLAWLLDKPDDWYSTVERLGDESPQGVYAVRSMVNELVALGYVTRSKTIDPATKRYVAEWEVREVPEMPEGASSPYVVDAEPCAETAGGSAATHARKPRVEPCAKTAPLTETELPKTETTPPTPPPAGGGGQGLALIESWANEDQSALQAITGGMASPPEQVLKAMATGGWRTLAEVPDMPAAVEAWWESQSPKPLIERKKVERLARDAGKSEYNPGQFLALLCVANVATPAGLELARNRLARADMPGMSGMRGSSPVRGKRGAMADEGKRLVEQARRDRARARERSGIIDAESEEVE